MSTLDKVFYYIFVVATFGWVYMAKVTILKAINDSKGN